MANFIKFLEITGIKVKNFKIHLATPNNPPSPLDEFLAGRFKEWQEDQNNENFKVCDENKTRCDCVVSLIRLEEKNHWLFAGVYKIISVNKGPQDCFRYQTLLLDGQEALIGKAIVEFERPGRQSYIYGEKFGRFLELVELRSQKYSVRFPGYNSICIRHRNLQDLIKQNEAAWKTALENVKGVYLITDTKTGEIYVGSATGDKGIWQRWCDYRNGHGGNEELMKLIAISGVSYAENYQYSILEIADFHNSDDKIILRREQHWMQVLCSRLSLNR